MPDQATWIAALRRERAGYEAAGKAERMVAVDAELRRLGAAVPAAQGAPETTQALRPPETATPAKPRKPRE